MTPEFEAALKQVQNAPADQLPTLAGYAATISATITQRLQAPAAPAQAPRTHLTVKQAAQRIGRSLSELYHSPAHYSFMHRRANGKKGWVVYADELEHYIENMLEP